MGIVLNKVNFTSNTEKITPPSPKYTGHVYPNTSQGGLSVYGGVPTEGLSEAFKQSAIASSGYSEISTFDAPYIGKGHIYKLNNGHTVVILPKHGSTTIETCVKVGSLNEPDNLKGISHFIEHNLYNGSSGFAPNEMTKALDYMGADHNASTRVDRTCFYVKTPFNDPKNIEKIVSMMADSIQNPTFSQEMLDKEKPIVLAEKDERSSGMDSLENILLSKFLGITLYDDNLLMGSEKTVNNIKRQDVVDYYNTWYTPDNMTTVIVGDVNPDKTIKLVSKYFNKTNTTSCDRSKRLYQNFKAIQQTKRIDLNFEDYNAAILNFVGPENTNIKDIVSLTGLLLSLNGQPHSKLRVALKPLTDNVDICKQHLGTRPGDRQIITVEADFRPGDEEDGLRTIYSVIDDMANHPISQEELNTVKSQMKTSFLLGLEDSKNVADFITDNLTANGNIDLFSDRLMLIDSLSADDIQNAARKYLNLNKVMIAMVHPDKRDKTSTTNKISFKGKDDNIDLSHIKQYRLPNNLNLVIDTTPGNTIGVLYFNLYSQQLPQTKIGTYQVLGEMLRMGPKNVSEEQYNTYNDVNSILEANCADKNNLIFKMVSDPDKISASLDILLSSVYNPDFSPEKFAKAKNRIKSDVKNEVESIVSKEKEELYGIQPYECSELAIKNNIDKVTIQDVIALYNQIVANAYGQMVVEMPEEKLPEFQNHIFSTLSSAIPPLTPNKPTCTFDSPPLQKNKVLIQKVKDNEAIVFQTFKTKTTGNIKDRMAIELLSTMLGDNSQSRLYKNLREKQHIVYNAYSSCKNITNSAGEINLVTKTSTKKGNENLKKVLEGFKSSINDLINTPVSQEELDGAKMALKSKLMNNSEISGYRSLDIEDGLNSPYGINLVNEEFKVIDSITPQNIQNAAKLYLNKPSLITISADESVLDGMDGYLSDFGEVYTVK